MGIKHTKEILQEAVNNSVSFSGVVRELKLKFSGGNQTHIKKKIIQFGIDYSHFTGQRTNSGKNHKGGYEKRTPQNTLKKSSKNRRECASLLRRVLIETGVKYECCECKINGFYNNKSITLQVDHIDGDWLNNEKENLRFLCPNCHSQTPNHGSKNTNAQFRIRYPEILNKKQPKIDKPIRIKKKYYCSICNVETKTKSPKCRNCHLSSRRVVVRPNKEWLNQLIYMLPVIEIAKLYEVTDNTIRKWCIYYNIEIPKLPTGFWLRGISPMQRQQA